MSKQLTAFDALELTPTATVAEIKLRWRQLASMHHPDHGGDAAIFHELRQAYHTALRQAQAPVRCTSCHGTGKSTVTLGFYSTTLPCTQCHGRGVIQREE